MTTTIPANVTAARAQVSASDYYALGYLTLSIASYYMDAQGAPAPADLIGGIDSQFSNPGTWQLEWGPAVSSHDANLLYVASYRDQASNLPIFAAVVLRGTDIHTGLWGILSQLKEDLGGGTQQAWPSGGAKIAAGTYSGMNEMLSLQAGGQTLVEFLGTFLPQYPGVPLVVTGHSLGGCLTSAIALDLASQPACSGVTIVPVTFAAPTAGNPDYVALYTKTFPSCVRWFNTWDLVPMAFVDMQNMDNAWGQGIYTNNPLSPFRNCNAPMGGTAHAIVAGIQSDVDANQWAHEQGSFERALNGQCLATSGSSADENWYSELLLQHLPACGYWTLMTKQYGSTLGPVTYPSWAPPLNCTGA
ncbi:MAG TPA: hypothetical protein VF432_25440 [Thermoanaerobaculia bacterium]